MVIRDLSYSDIGPSQAASRAGLRAPVQVASVTDRFLAFVLDAFIFSPVVSFLVSGLLRQLKTLLIVNSESEEVMIIWASFVMGIILFSSLLHSLFLYFWGASPGQKFMQLRVVSYPQKVHEKHPLSFAQGLLRSLGWWMGVGLGGLPFLEILGHPLRRAFHERASDTLVVSLKKEPVDIPLAVESHYIRSTLWMCFGFAFLIALAIVGKTYKTSLKAGLAGSPSVSKALCPEIPEEKYQGAQRLDLALALYFAEEVDEACVYTEAQDAVWNRKGDEKALGQLAMSLISDDKKEAEAYRQKICGETGASAACAISRYLATDEAHRGAFLQNGPLNLVSSRLLLLQDSLQRAQYARVLQLVRDLDKEAPLRPFVEKYLVRAAWTLKETARFQPNSRNPANEKAEQQLLEEFKKRYEIE